MRPSFSGKPPASLAESGPLAGYLEGVDFEIGSHDFFLHEFARLVDEAAATFENDEFSAFVRESVRLHVNPNERIRAAIARRLRRAGDEIGSRQRAVVRDVVAAVEDLDSPLENVGAVVRAYTQALLSRLEEAAPEAERRNSAAAAENAIADWRAGGCSFSDLRARLRSIGADALGAIADLLFEAPADSSKAKSALELLAGWNHPVAARTLAFAISEPLLEEDMEERAQTMVERSWPSARPFILYRLRQHTHEDIPFRWLELLIDIGEPRGVDRILEELIAHANDPFEAEDLRAILGLLGRSRDPGLEGKLVRFMTSAAAPPEALDLIEEWIDGTDLADRIDTSIARSNDGVPVLVTAGTDFLDFVGHHPDVGIDEARRRWAAAYHEALGWQRYSAYAWTELERDLDRELGNLIRQLMPSGRVDSETIRPFLEAARDRRLLDGDPPPLARILQNRSKESPWSKACLRGELNDWYVRAATAYDERDVERSIRILEVLLEVEPDAPMAGMLREIIRKTEGRKTDGEG